MSIRSKQNLFVFLLAGALVCGLSSAALAQNTPSGTSINNTATLDYSVGGTPQAQVSSNTATFVVDNKVDLTVTTIDGDVVSVIPGTFAQVLTYSVTNNGNTVQDYSLAALNSATGAFGRLETFDATNVAVYVDTDADNAYTAADTDLYIDELAFGATITVFVVADIPVAQINDDVASYDLVAQTAPLPAAPAVRRVRISSPMTLLLPITRSWSRSCSPTGPERPTALSMVSTRAWTATWSSPPI